MPKLIDLTGQKFGKWTVIKQAPHKKERIAWLCKCECGIEREIVGYNLVSKRGSKSCGCLKKESGQKQIINIIGKKFHKLTVLSKVGQREDKKNRHVYWLCKCECGNEIVMDGVALRGGHTKSCGCRREEVAFENSKKLLSKDPRLFSAKQIWRKKSNPRTNYEDGNLTFEQFIELTQLPCHYCGRSSQESNLYNAYKHRRKNQVLSRTALENLSDGDFRYNGLDRVDNSRPHDLDNVVPCCKFCNQAKMDRDYDEFVGWIKRAAKHLTQKEKDLDYSKSFSELSVS